MSVSQILDLETRVFVFGLLSLLCLKLLNGNINLRRLFADKFGTSPVRPERVQLLLATLAVAIQYIHNATISNSGTLPKIDVGWLYLLGGSNGVYLVRKTYERAKSSRQ